MTQPERTTDLGVALHRRFIVRTMISALRAVFNGNYNRERQLQNLKITLDYPFKEADYPCVVVEYEPQRNVAAGVGHEEWFTDANNVMRKWGHRRVEGTLTFNIFALTTLDRDILADAIEEVIAFGRLDSQLAHFYTVLYGDPSDPDVELIFNQIMVNSDEIDSGGNSESVAPWRPEDQLVYETTLSVEVHGGYYNVLPQDTWDYVTSASAAPYPQGDDTVVLDLTNAWTNPFVFEDNGKAVGVGVVSGTATP